jgi:hypothetical protein
MFPQKDIKMGNLRQNNQKLLVLKSRQIWRKTMNTGRYFKGELEIEHKKALQH